jgi:peptide/nickel transport system permease protein
VYGPVEEYLAVMAVARNRVTLASAALFVAIVALCLLAPVYAHDIAHTAPNDNHITETVSVGGTLKGTPHGGGQASKQVDVVSPTGVPIGPTWKGRSTAGATRSRSRRSRR